MKCSLGISNFLEEISSLSHSIVFLHFLALITEEGFIISPCYSLDLYIQMGMSFLSLLLFVSLLFTAACKAKLELFFTFLYDTDRLIFNCLYRASLDAQMVKNLPAVQET